MTALDAPESLANRQISETIEVVRPQIKILESMQRLHQWVTGAVNNQIVPSIRIMEARRNKSSGIPISVS